MKAQVTVLNKNFYKMDNGNEGANVIVYGDYISNNNKEGISISEASIGYEQHPRVTVFPAVYEVTIGFGEVKDKNGKVKTSMLLKDMKFLHEVDLVPKK